MEHEITTPGALLLPNGELAQVGWARQPLLECNLEQAAFYPAWKRPLQRLRIKRWDYYAVFTPQRFFSATIADLGYAANVFVYTLDWQTNRLHEEGLILPSWSVRLPRGSETGETVFEDKQTRLRFNATAGTRQVSVDWPGFDGGKGISARLALACPPEQESLVITIPIAGKRFYYNRKINCLPAEGLIHTGDVREVVDPATSSAALDWGRGVWAYRSYWNWASASGFLGDGRRVGLNLGCGFGDTSRASENALILDGKIHKLGAVKFDYAGAKEPGGYAKPWRFYAEAPGARRIDLTFTPFKERTATSNLLLIFSEVHQLFGRYSGCVTTDSGEVIQLDGLVGFAEEHHARW
jgi:hypothetical protein